MKSTDRSAAAPLPLADYLSFAIYSTNLAFGKAYKPMLDEAGLTYPQYITIIALAEQDAQTVSGLGEKLFLESNTLTPMLKKLEAMGYVERRRDKEDERVVRVSLTKSGRRLREKLLKIDLTGATALVHDEFVKLQKSIVTLRDNLIKAVQERE